MKNNIFVKACALLLCTILLAVTVAADETEPEPVDLDALFEAKTYTSDDGFTMKYRLYIPEDYDSSKAYPCLLFLHGAGERGDDNAAQIKTGLPCIFTDADSPAYEAIILAPQCPADFQWVDTPWGDGNYSVDNVPESKPMKAALAILEDVCLAYSVNRNRVYVTGLSMGGFGTWDALSRHSELFAAGMPLCGGGDPSCADVLATKPIRIFHDRNDGVVPVQGSSQMNKAIRKASDPDNVLVSFQLTTGYGHGIWDYVYGERENIDWLFSINAELEPVVRMKAPETEPAKTPAWFVPSSRFFWATRLTRMITVKSK